MSEPQKKQYDTHLIDGKARAASIRDALKTEIEEKALKPCLAVILVGDDPASQIYVRNKIRACEKAGIESRESKLPAKASQEEVHAEIEAFNSNPHVDGILLQLPLPDHLDSDALIQHIAPAKDVDGLTITNQGKLISADKSGLVPCTPQGSMTLIKDIQSDLSGMEALVIGRSLLFGKPMGQLLLAENCTVTQAHSRTRNLAEHCARADILVAAAGRPGMVRGTWIKPGAIVIDVGINRMEDGSLSGDVAFEEALGKARAITPVPGGVGPMTIACLLKNTVRAAEIN